MGTAVTNRVRELRQRGEGMTQQALAEAVGVSRQTIIAIEGGRYCPSLEVALKIARAFDRPVDAIFELPCEGT
jgi:putative transcriptional regulator